MGQFVFKLPDVGEGTAERRSSHGVRVGDVVKEMRAARRGRDDRPGDGGDDALRRRQDRLAMASQATWPRSAGRSSCSKPRASAPPPKRGCWLRNSKVRLGISAAAR